MASTVASAIRPSLREASSRQQAGSPHTPTGRFVSSAQSSPGSYPFRAEEDPIILELDPRGLSAGFQGESGPQCFVPFTSQSSKRVGDYRSFLPGFRRRRQDLAMKSKEYELWRNDLRDVDLGLLEDKLERAVREAYNKYLLVDAGTARLVLVLPSLVPHPVLSTALTLLFERWKYSTITLLPAPTMSVVGAGLRSGLVVEVGWEETVITAIYEYREIHVRRSVRAMKALTMKIGALLESVKKEQDESIRDSLVMDFDFVEEFLDRAGACHALFPSTEEDLSARTKAMDLEDQQHTDAFGVDTASMVIDWPTETSTRPIPVSKHALCEASFDTLVTPKTEEHRDDHEQSISQLLYTTLLALSSDARSICMSRIIFSGRGSFVAGLSQQVLDATNTIISEHGWTPVRGKHMKVKRSSLAELAQGRAVPADARHDLNPPGPDDFVEERLYKQRSKDAHQPVAAILRQVESLGPWAGASLVASLKAKSFVEIERERFLSHGLAGAHRDLDPGALHQQRSTATKGGERTSWTLAGWG
ncbi:uncharacterized protein Z520_00399 [Fonsecaea multimorphosa CBS 102226]|uniref:Actin-related protein RO7 n=1 Tax=Fonsecaea multimorphosa CBS 102226 TaxID=1442371 RepID=A0A0D2KC36_9EURO|nr:uncharacterized protein Z520_00399 [Fonsecaea multimorphosa CBS 102226]KIY03708.1 hypothetical protein Z520_00399 [Fonsecaea multimorphosa CBS 102226]OAL32408.1 hypothetical protein AYO22_00430 [Fonsecaea multimorphosa]